MGDIRKIFSFEIKQVGPESDRILRFCGSDETPDRDRDIVEVAGWQTDNYMKNPVFLWAHRYDIPPIGKCVKLIKDTANKKLMFDIKFPTTDELSSDVKNPAEHAKFVDMIYNMYKNKYLNATSVGFTGIKYKTRDDDAVLALSEWQRGRRYIEQELLELSACPVPANANALQDAKSKGLINDIQIKSYFIPENQGENLSTKIDVYWCEDSEAQKLLDLARNYIKQIGFTEERIVIDGKEKDVTCFCTEGKSVNFGFGLLDDEKGSISIGMPIKDIKSGARLSKESFETLKSIKDVLENAVSDHRKAHKEAMSTYKDCMKRLGEGEESDNIKDDMEDAMDDHSIAHKSAMKCYKTCIKSFVDFMGSDSDNDDGGADTGFNPTIDNSSGASTQNGNTSDGVEVPKSIETTLKNILGRLDNIEESQKSNDTGAEIDLDSIDVPKAAKTAVNDELNIEPGEIAKLIQQSVANAVKSAVDAAKGKI